MDSVLDVLRWLFAWVQPLPGLPLVATVFDCIACGGTLYMVAFHYRGPVKSRWRTWLAFILGLSAGLTCIFDVAAMMGIPGAGRLAYVANTGINVMLFSALIAVRGNIGQLLKRPMQADQPGPGPS
ncbi:phage holin family protein [Pseudomonas nitroreducens]|uniref:phage holin family protein n=1 Tax=Pseudomonas nitroreducens TaxID=46680 RepID=UPI000363F8C1|nr:phage holin family protein [Pseudomonas nitroreducens]